MTTRPNPAELLESVIQRTLSKPNLTQQDREDLEQAVFVTRTLPQVGTVKRNLAAKLIASLGRTDKMLQGIINSDRLHEGEKESWEDIAKTLQAVVDNLKDSEAKKAAKGPRP